MKPSRLVRLVIMLLVVLPLWSCSRKPPATRLDREKWNHATLNGGYDSVGNRNPKWDKDAKEALSDFADRRTASVDEMDSLSELIGGATDNALAAGCDDPMVGYLHVRFSAHVRARALKERQDLYVDAADKLESSAYPPIRKFYANVDAAELLWLRRDTNLWPQVERHRHAAIDDLTQALQEKSFPEAEAYSAASTLFTMLAHNARQLTNAYTQIAPALSHQRDKAAMADFVQAAFYREYAWLARGHGYANQVTEENWRLFHERLDLARKALEHAWSLDPRDPQIPTLMISIILGQEKGRPEMEKWFARAMKADRNNYAACRAKLNFLLPQWYGSREDMVEFGRQCAASTNWGGQVPLILVDAHSDFDGTLAEETRASYWSLPDVWPDIQAGYEKFAVLNPDAIRFHYPYARYALRCGQTNVFLEQIKLIRQQDGEVKYAYFGGKEAFDRTMAVATGAAVPVPGR